MKASEIPIPKAWPQMIRKAMIHVVSLAYTVIHCSREQASNSRVKSTNVKGELEQAENENRIFLACAADTSKAGHLAKGTGALYHLV